MLKNMILATLLALFSSLALANDILVSSSSLKSKPSANDILNVYEACNAKSLPLRESGAKLEMKGDGGKTMIGNSIYRWRLSKGTDFYEFGVIDNKSEKQIQNGDFEVAGSLGGGTGCTHVRQFRLAPINESPTDCATRGNPEQATPVAK